MKITFRNPVARTCCWIAAARDLESRRPDRLFEDPFACHLHQMSDVEAFSDLGRDAIAYLALRTRYLDDLCRAAMARGIAQVVDVAAGMDTRAYRLDWPPGTRFYELDREEVLSEKETVLKELGAVPACIRRSAAVDLTGPWPDALLRLEFDPKRPSLWLVEGLVMYLNPSEVDRLLANLSGLAGPGSLLGADVAGQRILDPELRQELMDRFGFYWRFGTDEPAPWFERHGWLVTVDEPASWGHRFNRVYAGYDLLDGRFVMGVKR